MKLVKSNSHGNNINVCQGHHYYYKTAIKEEGKTTIDREREGYKWFGIKVRYSPTNSFIEIPEFKGKTFPFYNGISGNEEWIIKLIQFYKAKWGGSKFAVHGDLALCNVIFGDRVYIVDWEHFHYASREFYGFDIINMLFIHLQYEYRWLTYWGWNWVPFVKPRHRIFIREAIEMLEDTRFLRDPFINSADYINKYMDKDKFILGKQKGNILESLDYLLV